MTQLSPYGIQSHYYIHGLGCLDFCNMTVRFTVGVYESAKLFKPSEVWLYKYPDCNLYQAFIKSDQTEITKAYDKYLNALIME